MKEAFQILKDFFVGTAYTVFAAGCVLAVLSPEVTYRAFFAALIFSILLLILSWVTAIASKGLP